MKKKARPLNYQNPKHHRQRHQHTPNYLKTYWPYLPALLLLGWWLMAPIAPAIIKNRVLAYATNMSSSGLLSATNARRAENGAGSLTINTQLTQAAQAKANDMVSRNYWSHNTPDGEEPWVFIQAAGYEYVKAGENLAYGFDSSDEAVTGWMNSPSHKANMLDTAFKEVGFGIANNADYQSNGNQTIVVAMYGNPYSPPAQPATCPEGQTGTPPDCQSTPQKTVAAANNQSASPPASQATPTPEAASEETTVEEDTVKPAELNVNFANIGYTTEAVGAAQAVSEQSISRLQSLTGGKYPWINALLSAAIALALSVYIFKHVLAVRRVIVSGEQFIIKHPALDVLLMLVVAVGLYLASQTGRIL